MSVQATYDVRIDLNGSRVFSDANENVSDDWKRMTWRLGVGKPFDALARAASCEIVLNNADGRFSPEHGSGLAGFRPGALVRIRTTYDGATRQHFIGWIAPGGIRPAPGTRGKRETVVQAQGWLSRIQDVEVTLEVQEGKRTDEVILALMQAANVYPPGTMGWLLGLPGSTSLGETTRLSTGFSDFTDLDAGATILNYAGDNWEEGVSVYGALRDVVAAEGEGALLYVDREGKLIFRSRHWPHGDMYNAGDATLTQSDIKEGGLDYGYGGRIVNDVTVGLRPRTVTGSESSKVTLGTIDRALRVDPGESETTRIRYDDGSGERIGGKSVEIGDYTATANQDGSGADLTSQVSAAITEEGGTSATVEFTNGSSRPAFIQPGASVKGVKITDFGKQEITHADEDSILAYGRQKECLQLSLLDDTRFAESLAEGLVYLRKEPMGEIAAVTMVANKSDSLMQQALARTIGDRIQLSEGQTGASGEYFIVGEQHQVNGQRHHLVTWTLRPAFETLLWVFGGVGDDYPGLGEETRLGF